MHFSDADAADTRVLIEYLDAATRTSAELKQATYAAQRISAGMRVLDAGCGTGDDVRAIARLVGPQGRAAGVDSSAALIGEARARGVPPNAQFAVADAGALPFPDASFDAVRAERVFQHLANPEPAARELRRVLAPGGSALLLDQDWESLAVAGADRETTRRIVRSFVDGLAGGWAGREARGLLLGAGFAYVTSVPFVSMPPLPLAFDTVLQPAMDAALRDGSVDSESARRWLQSLLEADLRGAFFCAVLVVVTVGSNAAPPAAAPDSPG
jgi:SAM-dependent methyltransferase